MLTSACDVTRIVRSPIKKYRIALIELPEVDNAEGEVVASIDADMSEKGYVLFLERSAKILHKPTDAWEKNS